MQKSDSFYQGCGANRTGAAPVRTAPGAAKKFCGAVWCCTGAMSFINFAVRCCTGAMSFHLLGGAVCTGVNIAGAVLQWCTTILYTGGVVHTSAARMFMVRWCKHRCKEKKNHQTSNLIKNSGYKNH